MKSSGRDQQPSLGPRPRVTRGPCEKAGFLIHGSDRWAWALKVPVSASHTKTWGEFSNDSIPEVHEPFQFPQHSGVAGPYTPTCWGGWEAEVEWARDLPSIHRGQRWLVHDGVTHSPSGHASDELRILFSWFCGTESCRGHCVHHPFTPKSEARWHLL